MPGGVWDHDVGDENWVTKWDAQERTRAELDGDETYFDFKTAWLPLIPIFQKLEELGGRVDAVYDEPECAFAGWYKRCVDERFISTNDSSAEWIE